MNLVTATAAALAAFTAALPVVWRLLVIIAVARGLIILGGRLIEQAFKVRGPLRPLGDNRARTLSALLKSALRYAVDFAAIISILQLFDVDTSSYLAGAGIIGLAVGFGAQNLVRDVITGFFILFEEQFDVGEYVSLGDVSGVVEEMGLRVTKVRAFNGDLHVIPNGSIARATNHQRGSRGAMVDINVALDTDLRRAQQVLQEAVTAWAAGDDRVVEGPTVLGVASLQDSGITLRLVCRTQPLAEWGVERELRQVAVEVFAKAGIELPYLHRVVIPGGRS